MAKSKRPTAPPPPPKRTATNNGGSSGGFEMPSREFRPPKLVIVGVEGWGKTSLAAHVPDVAIIMPETETGYLTLVGVNRAPEVPCLVTKTWKQTMDAIDKFDGKALALDELSGFEKQCHEYVCNNDFSGNWNHFWAYHKGVRMAVPEWMKFLAKLEQLNCMVIALSHCAVETFKDPTNEDHDRYVAALFKDTWGITRRWADACLFGTFVSVVDDSGKGIGGEQRVLYTEHRDTHDAKNRYGMDPEIDIPDEVGDVWAEIWGAINNQKTIDEGDEE